MRIGAFVRAIGLPYWILAGALAGIALGILFGDGAAVLAPLGRTYIGLLQMVIYPYLLCSLLHGLGRLAPNKALRLLKAGVAIFLAAAVGLFAAIYLLGLAIPEPRPPVVVSPSTRSAAQELVALLIPANPFADLSENRVPAIVLLGIFFGIAIQRMDGKEALLDWLDVLRRASAKIWRWVAYLAPLGVMALFADLAGTVRLDQLGGILQYLLLFGLGAAALGLVAIPLVAAALTPIGYREMLSAMKTALAMSIATSLLVSAVPYIIRFVQEFAARLGVEEEDRDEIVATTTAVAYAIVEFGNWFISLFILFAASFYHHALSLTQTALLPFMTILSTVGSPTSTVVAAEFLAAWIGLPDGTRDLYVETSAVTRYPQVLLSAMGLGLIVSLVVLSYYGRLTIRLRRVVPAVAASVALIGVIAVAGWAARPYLIPAQQNPYLAFELPGALRAAVDYTIRRPGAPEGAAADQGDDRSIMARVRDTGTLRVGYNPNVIPFSYLNAAGELVGYDIELVLSLARDLNVAVEFIAFDWQSLLADLEAERFDLAVGGIYVTDERLRQIEMTRSQIAAPLALIVPSDQADGFLSKAAILGRDDLTIAVFRDPVVEPLARALFPHGTVQVVETFADIVGKPAIDAALWTLQQSRAWALTHPGYSAVVPDNLGAPLAIAFALPKGADGLLRFVDYWLTLQDLGGLRERLNAYWIEGEPRAHSEPRWSVVRNVLHWVD